MMKIFFNLYNMSLENNDSFWWSKELLNIQAEAIIDHLRKKFKIETRDILYFTNTNWIVNYKVWLKGWEIATWKFEITNLGYIVDENLDTWSKVPKFVEEYLPTFAPVFGSILELNSKK